MKRSKTVKEWLIITVCSVIYSLGIALFLSPTGLAAGGVSGISIIINQLTGLGTGLMIIILNTPLLLAGFLVIGRGFLIKTVYVTLFSSFLIDLWPKVMPSLVPVTTDKLLAAVAGAVLAAVGMGGIFRCGGSTGGTDIVAKLLRRRFKTLKTGSLFLIVDSVIVMASAVVSRNLEDALYAAIALFITSRLFDVILYGTDEAKLLIIISQEPDKVAAALLDEADAGVTFAEGAGAYTGEAKRIILCAIRKQSFPRAKELVNQIDPRAFMIVSDAKEVFGEGYKLHSAEEL
ncbi:MAG: YitT family protein [Ruminococcaceae bacterium]|nr:YitT family protein [Oscillospiraceae bacterium]